MAIINGVNCSEIVSGYEERAGSGGLGASKQYVCAWGDRYRLANGLVGSVAPAAVVGAAVILSAPARHPESPNLLVSQVRIRGVGTPFQGDVQLAFPYAIVSVEYGVPPYAPYAGDPNAALHNIDPSQPLLYVTQAIDFGAQYLTIPASGLKFGNGNKLKQDYSLPIGVVTFSLTYHLMPYLPTFTTGIKVGSLNSTTFFRMAAGYVMFNGMHTQVKNSSDGTRTQEVSQRFSWRDIATWDCIFDPTSSSWQPVQNLAGDSLLPTGDFNTLIPEGYR